MKFTPEMFRMLDLRIKSKEGEISFVTRHATESIASLANAALEKHLASLPVVYLHGSLAEEVKWSILEKNYGYSTHQAVLFNVQEIEKKECEHPVVEYPMHRKGLPVTLANCGVCGIKLKAKWEPA